MGKTDYNPLGQWRGRVGGLVYKVVNGKQVVTPYDEKTRGAQSEAQMMQQAKFALAGKLSKITPYQVLTGLASNKAERRKEFFSAIAVAASCNATATGYQAALDAPKLKLSKGDVFNLQASVAFNSGTVIANYVNVDDKINAIMTVAFIANATNNEYSLCGYKLAYNNLGAVNASIATGITAAGSVAIVYAIPLSLTAEAQGFLASAGNLELGNGDDEYVLNVLLSSVEGAFKWNRSNYLGAFEIGGAVTYSLNIVNNNTAMGTVSGNGFYNAGSSAVVTATPNAGYIFKHWIVNGSQITTNPYSITINENTSIQAVFEADTTAQTHTVQVSASPSNGGTVTGAGNYNAGSYASLEAIPAAGFYFDKWNDGETANPRSVQVNSDISMQAIFAEGAGETEEFNFSGDMTASVDGSPINSGTQVEVGKTIQVVYTGAANFVSWNSLNKSTNQTQQWGAGQTTYNIIMTNYPIEISPNVNQPSGTNVNIDLIASCYINNVLQNHSTTYTCPAGTQLTIRHTSSDYDIYQAYFTPTGGTRQLIGSSYEFTWTPTTSGVLYLTASQAE